MQKRIFPLTEGNMWTVKRRNHTIEYAPQAQMINGQQWFSVPPFTNDEYLQEREDGIWVRTKEDEEFLFYKFPIALGATWSAGTINNKFNFEVTALEKQTTVPAGTFPCVIYEREYPNGKRDRMYFSVDIGLILWESFDESTNQWELVEELINYNVQ
jgi:hypothetical protein